MAGYMSVRRLMTAGTVYARKTLKADGNSVKIMGTFKIELQRFLCLSAGHVRIC